MQLIRTITLLHIIRTCICSIAKNFRLISVTDEVVNVSHFMMHCYQIFVIHTGAHFNPAEPKHFNNLTDDQSQSPLPVIVSITEIPRRWLAYNHSVRRLFQNRVDPKVCRQYGHIHGQEKFFGQLKHNVRSVSLGCHLWCHFQKTATRVWNRNV